VHLSYFPGCHVDADHAAKVCAMPGLTRATSWAGSDCGALTC
jgi:hypothetical protein